MLFNWSSTHDEGSRHLSRISTLWSLVDQAHGATGEPAFDAQRRLLHRYCGAAYRYLLGATHDEEVALELFQEFALRIVRGDFRRAAPERGRFRDYVKRALINLVTDYHRARRGWPTPLPADVADASPPTPDEDQQFIESWRGEIIDRAWQSLAEANATFYAVLKLHAELPQASAAEVASRLGAELDRPLSPGNVRVILHRARDKFAALMLDEVAFSLGSPTLEEVEQELHELGLATLCRRALDARRTADAPSTTPADSQ